MTAPYLVNNQISVDATVVGWQALTNTAINGGDIPFFYSVEHSADNNTFFTWTVDPVKTTYF
jgi:hypothetical protein